MPLRRSRASLQQAPAASQDGRPLEQQITEAVAADLGTHEARTDNPHVVTKTQVGLGNVPNLDTTDAVARAHDRQHAIDAGADHTGVAGAVENNLVAFDANGLPQDSGAAPADFEAAGAVATHAAIVDAHHGHKRSVEVDAGDVQLAGDVDSPGANQVYGTDGAGARGWKADPAGGGGSPTEQTTALTGTQDDFSLDAGFTYLRCTNASALVLTGFSVGGSPPSAGDRVIIDAIGAGTVQVADEDVGSTAANRVLTPSDNGQIIGPEGRMVLTYDGTTDRWREALVEPGVAIDIPHGGLTFDGLGGMTWTVAAGDLELFNYQQRGTVVAYWLRIVDSTFADTANPTCRLRESTLLPGGFTTFDNAGSRIPCFVRDNNVTQVGWALAAASSIRFNKADLSNWTLSADVNDMQFNGLQILVE